MSVGTLTMADSEGAMDVQRQFHKGVASGNVSDLHSLIAKLELSDYAENADKARKLEIYLSETYEELTHINVPLSEDIESFLTNTLLNLRYFTKCNNKEEGCKESYVLLEDVLERIGIIDKLIDLLLRKFSKGVEAGDLFVFVCRKLAIHLHILKYQLKCTYDKLPWEEIEFCLVAYVMTVFKPNEADDIYRLVLDKQKLLAYLEAFSQGLLRVKGELDEKKINRKVKLGNRPQMMESVKKFNNKFEALYDDYNLMRDVYSLKRIDSYIRLCYTLDFEEDEEKDKLVIERTLQVIGESLKDTPESPNISQELQRMLLNSSSKLQEVVTSLRYSLSHTDTLLQKVNIETGHSKRFFREVQNDLGKVHFEISDVLFRRKLSALDVFCKKILRCTCLSEAQMLHRNIRKLDLKGFEFSNISRKDIEKVESLVQHVEEEIKIPTHKEKHLLEKLKKEIDKHKTKLSVTLEVCKDLSLFIFACLNEFEVNNNLETLKNSFRIVSELLFSYLIQSNFRKIMYPVWELRSSIKSRLSDTNMEKAYVILSDILDMLVLKSEGVGEVNRFKANLEKTDVSDSVKWERNMDMIVINLGKYLQVESLRKGFMTAYKARKEIHKAKRDLFSTIDKKMNGIEEVTHCKNLLTQLKVKEEDKEDFLVNYSCGDLEACKGLAKKIDDSYGTFKKIFSENNIFSYKKQEKGLRIFLSSLKLKKVVVEELVKKFVSDVKQQVQEFFIQRLKILKRVLLAEEKVDIMNVVRKFNSDTKSQVITELVVLDLMNILESASLFIDDKLFLDDCAPILIGKSLRNYLAHGNILLDILPYSGSCSITCNALKLIEQGKDIVEYQTVLIGKKVPSSIFKSQNIFKEMKCLLIQTALYSAVKRFALSDVKGLIKEGGNIKGKDIEGSNLLHYCAVSDNLEAFIFFLDYGIDEIENKLGETPLDVAIINGSSNIFNYCLSLHKRHYDAEKLLRTAARCGQREMLEKLLSKCDNVSKEVFYEAILNNHLDIADLLLRKLRNDRRNKNYPKSLHYAVLGGNYDIAEMLLVNGFDVNLIVDGGYPPMHYAVYNGHEDIVNLLLKHGAKINYNEVISNSAAVDLDPDYFPPLHLACLCGHRNIAEVLLKQGAATDYAMKGVFTPFQIAAACGRKEIIELLLSVGEDPNLTPENGLSPLHLAVEYGHFGVAEFLLNSGADANSRNNEHFTPLHLSCQYGTVDVIEKLLEKGANIHAKTSAGNSALHIAVEAGRSDIVEYFFKAKFDVDVSDNVPYLASLDNYKIDVDLANNEGHSPLHIASEYGHNKIVNMLLENAANINIKDKYELTPLHYAIEQNYSDTAHILIAHGADPNLYDADRHTPLHMAAKNGLTQIVNCLIEKKVDVNAKAKELVTAIHLAASYGHDEIVKVLIEAGAYINGETDTGITPLFCSARNGHIKLISLLIENGALINKSDVFGITPLHFACQNGYKDVVEDLLSYDADMFAVDNGGATPLHLACQNGFLDIVDILLQQGADVNKASATGETPLHVAAESGSPSLVNFLLQKGAELVCLDSEGYTPLHVAAQRGHDEVVLQLVQVGISVNSKSFSDVTPLHMAAEHGSKSVVRILVENGAEVNSLESENYTPLHIASQYSNEDAVAALLNAGAQTNFETIDGLTSLHLAAQGGNSNIVSMLLEKGALVNAASTDNTVPLHLACLQGHENIIRILLQDGASAELANDEGLTPLELTVIAGHRDIADLISEKKNQIIPEEKFSDTETPSSQEISANGELDSRKQTFSENKEMSSNIKTSPDKRKGSGEEDKWISSPTAISNSLYTAMVVGDEDALNDLFEAGIDLNSIQFNGWSPLHLAVEKGDANLTFNLLAHGAHVNIQSSNGYTPLHLASNEGHKDIIKILLNEGADMTLTPPEECPPAHLAARNGHLDCVSIFLKRGCDIYARNFHDTLLHQATASANIELLKYVLEYIIQNGDKDYVDVKDDEGDTPLMWAVENKLYEAAKLLLLYGADVNIQNEDGMTALHWAVEIDDLELLALMLKEPNVDLTIRDKNGKNIFDLFRKEYGSLKDNHKIKEIKMILDTKLK